jgi:MFS family permease
MMTDDGFGQLGFYILAVLYLFMGIGSLVSTAIMRRFGTKTCLLLGGIGNVQWILSSILASKFSVAD